MKREHISRRGIVAITCVAILGTVIVFLTIVMTRGLPSIDAEITYQHNEKPLQITGLNVGQAAIGSEGSVKAVYGDDIAVPTASMAKVLTSLVALQKSDDLDQVIVLDARDETFYRKTLAVNGSRLQVVAGEQLTIRQMHEAMLILSANNIADSLVYHLFGTQDNYKTAANKWITEHGLKKTSIGADASGLDPGTVSSPSDMIKIGQEALKSSVVSKIVSTRSTVFPLAGEVENTNDLLAEGYFGIKTGNTNEAGSCLLFATEYEDEAIIGVLMGQEYHSTFDIAKNMTEQVKNNFSQITIPAGSVVGKYALPWGGEAQIVTNKVIDSFTWGDAEISFEINPYQHSAFSQNVGTLSLDDETSDLKVESTVAGANLFWRLTHLDQLKW